MKEFFTEKLVMTTYTVVVFLALMLFEYHFNDWHGVSLTIVGYSFGWYGKKWYDEAKKSEGARR